MPVRWPLPPEHRYSRCKHSSYLHDGSDNHQESMWLRLWQAKVRFRFPDVRLQATGLMDGPTQKVAIALQHEAGLSETGMIDEDTWYLAWK